MQDHFLWQPVPYVLHVLHQHTQLLVHLNAIPAHPDCYFLEHAFHPKIHQFVHPLIIPTYSRFNKHVPTHVLPSTLLTALFLFIAIYLLLHLAGFPLQNLVMYLPSILPIFLDSPLHILLSYRPYHLLLHQQVVRHSY